jgi:hypothetical protein
MLIAVTTAAQAALATVLLGTTPADPVAATRAADACQVTGAAGNADDVTRARTACAAARRRFGELLGSEAPRVRIVLSDRPGYRVGLDGGTGIVHWPTGATLAEQAGRSIAAERTVAAQWREVLPHETMHALMVAAFYPDGFTPEGYGTPLPDWLEEGIGIWGEPAASREIRLEQARSLSAARRDLTAILASTHPAATNRRLLAARDSVPAPADDRTLWAFYPQSVAVVAFVHDAGGAAAVRELVRRLVADPQDDAALAGLPGLPGSMPDVLDAWDAWMEPPLSSR